MKTTTISLEYVRTMQKLDTWRSDNPDTHLCFCKDVFCNYWNIPKDIKKVWLISETKDNGGYYWRILGRSGFIVINKKTKRIDTELYCFLKKQNVTNGYLNLYYET